MLAGEPASNILLSQVIDSFTDQILNVCYHKLDEVLKSCRTGQPREVKSARYRSPDYAIEFEDLPEYTKQKQDYGNSGCQFVDRLFRPDISYLWRHASQLFL